MDDLGLGQFVDRDTIRIVREFPHPPERVWCALSSAEQISAWWWPCTLFEARAGGRYAFEFDGKSFKGLLKEFDPPRAIDFSGVMRFELSEQRDGCRLVLTLKRTPAGWSPMALAGFHGWLGRLARLVGGVANEDAERWASQEFPWEAVFFAYEKMLALRLTDGARPIFRVHFEANESAPNSDGRNQLEELAQMLRERPALRVAIDGFGDDPCSESESLVLSQRRVDAVTRHLEDAGIARGRIEVGFALGNYHFLVPRDTEAGRAFNRRVEARPIY